MAFTLAQASTVTMPTQLGGARIYISLGSPMYIPISSDDSGWGGPDLLNPSDPNADVYFDWYEFTYTYGAVPFGGNTTQVDQFGLPLTARLQQTSSGFDQTNGITLSKVRSSRSTPPVWLLPSRGWPIPIVLSRHALRRLSCPAAARRITCRHILIKPGTTPPPTSSL